MRTVSPRELSEMNYNVLFVNALKQLWRTTRDFQCFGAPKTQNLFLYLSGCKITYTDKAGRVFSAKDGDIVYTPMGSEYKAVLSDFEREDSHTVGINFFLKDETGEPLLLSEGIKIFHPPRAEACRALFHQVLNAVTPRAVTRCRILLMEILEALAPHSALEGCPLYLERALSYLTEHVEKKTSVAELAGLCFVSEAYLRRQFQRYVGVSPSEYRNALRLERARSYLEYGDISVGEISETLGYATLSHFIKAFKKQYGSSPHQYRKCFRSYTK